MNTQTQPENITDGIKIKKIWFLCKSVAHIKEIGECAGGGVCVVEADIT